MILAKGNYLLLTLKIFYLKKKSLYIYVWTQSMGTVRPMDHVLAGLFLGPVESSSYLSTLQADFSWLDSS